MFGDTQLTATYPSTPNLQYIVKGDPNPPPDGIYKIVATEGGCEDWAAYMESEGSRMEGNTIEAIRSWGNKIPQHDAERLFPDWADHLDWRR